MKFFIPHAKNKNEEQSVYESIKKFLSEELGAKFSNRRIFSIGYLHNGKDYYAEVGKVNTFNDETVIAILYEDQRRLYHICTPNSGVLRDMSIFVGYNEIRDVVDFDGE